MLTNNRRTFLAATGGAFSGLFLNGCAAMSRPERGLSGGSDGPSRQLSVPLFGPLKQDPAGLLDLPEGFSYRILSQLGETMDDGFRIPDRADGMGCFALGDGEIALVRNHELQPHHDGGEVIGTAYDTKAKSLIPLPGGTTTIVLDTDSLAVKRQFRTLAGTIRNCAGGITPWGSWLSCEESVLTPDGNISRDHGYVFEVPASATGLIDPMPLEAMGRFNHEAACVDPDTGIVYMTEDREDSLLYRFVPKEPGRLAAGGILQAMLIDGLRDTRNWNGARELKVGQEVLVSWLTLDNVQSPEDDLRDRGARTGAALIARGEGIWMGDGEFYFTATSGGVEREGQIFRLRIGARGDGADVLELFFESGGIEQYSFGDNLCVAPFGHLVVCEDQYTDTVTNHLRGITPNGESYPLAFLKRQTELAGACFSPDGKTLFVNAYSPAMTIAIQGPWPSFLDK